MRAIRRRMPDPAGRRLLRDAGPPNAWVVIAFIAVTPIVALATATSGGSRLFLIVAAVLVLTLPSILDREGWRIRIGTAWLAAEQRRRMPGLTRIPRTTAGAERWLEQAEAVDSGLTRASVLLTAGNTAEARRLVESHPIADPEDRARVARMLAAIDGLEQGQVDPTEANAAIAALPPDARRYHALSLAWSTAWVDGANGRPWRSALADASRGIGVAGIPGRFLTYAAFQELLLPILGLLVVLLFTLVGWL
jgi:hypothetical protein